MDPAEGAGRNSSWIPARHPEAIDITPLEGQESGQIAACIYSLEKGRLMICIPSTAPGKDPGLRPQQFKTRDGDGQILFVSNASARKDRSIPARGTRPWRVSRRSSGTISGRKWHSRTPRSRRGRPRHGEKSRPRNNRRPNNSPGASSSWPRNGQRPA